MRLIIKNEVGIFVLDFKEVRKEKYLDNCIGFYSGDNCNMFLDINIYRLKCFKNDVHDYYEIVKK